MTVKYKKVYTRSEFLDELQKMYQHWFRLSQNEMQYQEFKLLYFIGSNFQHQVLEGYILELTYQIKVKVQKNFQEQLN